MFLKQTKAYSEIQLCLNARQTFYCVTRENITIQQEIKF